jgi:hypothetical protein
MRTLKVWIVSLALGGLCLCPGQSASEEWGEWRSLFDGKTFSGWKLLGTGEPPTQGWKIEDGILKKIHRERGGNLASEETFEEFELSWEWLLPPGANNGVKYFVVPQRGASIGHEYQMIDDSRVGSEKGKTGSFYAVMPPKPDRKPTRIGEWNQSRIKVRGQHVEHWLNGELILRYELGSPEVLASVARSKFKSVDKFGTRVRGHILLTDHTDEAWYRNLRIRVPRN